MWTWPTKPAEVDLAGTQRGEEHDRGDDCKSLQCVLPRVWRCYTRCRLSGHTRGRPTSLDVETAGDGRSILGADILLTRSTAGPPMNRRAIAFLVFVLPISGCQVVSSGVTEAQPPSGLRVAVS